MRGSGGTIIGAPGLIGIFDSGETPHAICCALVFRYRCNVLGD
jgi:hypothetical protein